MPQKSKGGKSPAAGGAPKAPQVKRNTSVGERTANVALSFPLDRPYVFNFTSFGAQRKVEVLQFPQVHEIGGVLWDCGYIITRFLTNERFFRPGYWNGKSAVELGAACALPAMCIAQLGAAPVITTDMADIVEGVTEPNVRHNGAGGGRACKAAIAAPLMWGDEADIEAVRKQLPGGKCDVLFAADVAYQSAMYEVLFRTILALAHERSVFYYVHRQRMANEDYFMEPLLEAFEIESAIDGREAVPEYPLPAVTIYTLRLRGTGAAAAKGKSGKKK